MSTVKKGDAAVGTVEVVRPAPILMDIRLQVEKDVIETAEIIRKRIDIPIDFSTAYLDEERIERMKITIFEIH